MIELRPGIRWARRKPKPYDRTPNVWSMVELKGHVPFLTAEIFYITKESTSDSEFCQITNPDEWEWGPEIEIPDKNWIEVRELKNDSLGIGEFLK